MKIVVTTMVSLDGVMQGLGGEEEDRRGGFERGGWAAAFFGGDTGDLLGRIYGRADAFLFGRWTFDVFAASWGSIKDIPQDNQVAVALNSRPKFVVSRDRTPPAWGNSAVLEGDVAEAVRELKARPGGELQVHGSRQLVQWLFANDLVDELNLLTCPLVIGQGARLFPDSGPDQLFDLLEVHSTSSGVVIQNYRLAGRPIYKLAGFETTAAT